MVDKNKFMIYTEKKENIFGETLQKFKNKEKNDFRKINIRLNKRVF